MPRQVVHLKPRRTSIQTEYDFLFLCLIQNSANGHDVYDSYKAMVRGNYLNEYRCVLHVTAWLYTLCIRPLRRTSCRWTFVTSIVSPFEACDRTELVQTNVASSSPCAWNRFCARTLVRLGGLTDMTLWSFSLA